MKKIIATLLLSSLSVVAAPWYSYPYGIPSVTDTFLFGTFATNKLITARQLGNYTADNLQYTNSSVTAASSTSLNYAVANNFTVTSPGGGVSSTVITFTNMYVQTNRVLLSNVILNNQTTGNLSVTFNTNVYYAGGVNGMLVTNGSVVVPTKSSTSLLLYFTNP